MYVTGRIQKTDIHLFIIYKIINKQSYKRTKFSGGVEHSSTEISELTLSQSSFFTFRSKDSVWRCGQADDQARYA